MPKDSVAPLRTNTATVWEVMENFPVQNASPPETGKGSLAPSRCDTSSAADVAVASGRFGFSIFLPRGLIEVKPVEYPMKERREHKPDRGKKNHATEQRITRGKELGCR